ncbi:hypothetical protein AURDEDRAFT_143535 [Auricularia subglabra TFB-10046 SS5]|nr:hypothetical protein AURDEDRAFT_143535 [Auricularia subglabra TFB-10046 SS5]
MGAPTKPLDELTADEMICVGQNFKPVPRVSATAHDLEARIADHMASGVPLLIFGCQDLVGWDEEAFGIENLQHQTESDRAIYQYTRDLAAAPALKREHDSEQGSAPTSYLKDHPCPDSWEKQLRCLQGPISNLLPLSPSDLTTFLPERARPETLMCYIGRSGTRTALHRDRCASVGQNLMAHTEDDGHSIWLLTETGDAEKVARHFNSDDVVVEFEHHVATLNELASADFTVYIAKQVAGDLIYVPSRSTHQVVNRGGLTCKIAWSRMSTQSIDLCLSSELPVLNVLRVPEVYRTKMLLHHAVLGLTATLRASGTFANPTAAKWLTDLLPVYDRLICEEWSEEDIPLADHAEDALLVCDSCGHDIFRVYWICDSPDERCRAAEGDVVVLCSSCYTVGRTCKCRAMKALCLTTTEALVDARNAAASVVHGDEEHGKDIDTILASGHMSMVHAAELIHVKRTEPPKYITCHYMNYHAIWAVEGHFCRRCGRRVCFRCFGSRARVHAAEVLLKPFEQDELHRLHRGEVDDEDRDAHAVILGNAVARAHLARPVPEGTAGGWYDAGENGEPVVVETRSPAPQKRKREPREEERGDEQMAMELSGWRSTRKIRRNENGIPNGKGIPQPLTAGKSLPARKPRQSGGKAAAAAAPAASTSSGNPVSLEEVRDQGVALLGWDLPPVPSRPARAAPTERELYAERLAGKLMQLIEEQQKIQSRLNQW